MPLAFVTTRTLSSLEYIFDDIDINFPLVVMNGAAVYHFKEKTYDNIYTIKKEVSNYIDQELNKENINAFIYTVDDDMLHCYYHHLTNEEEVKFYQERRKNNFDNFVRATVPSDLNASLYIIIEKNEKINQLVSILENSIYILDIDIVVQPLNEKYSTVKINSKPARKENSIKILKEKNSFDKVIVCGSGNTDIPLIKQSDFSFCLNTAPDYVKEVVDVVIKDDLETYIFLDNELKKQYVSLSKLI